MLKTIKHYCQKCLAPNPLGRELCARCGTRLMLVVKPSASRFDDSAPVAVHDEHLLERVSSLENRFTRLADKLDQALDLLLRQAKHSYFDHALVEMLINVLGNDAGLDVARLNKLWRERCRQDATDQARKARHEILRGRILAAHRGAVHKAVEDYVNRGIDLLNQNDAVRAMQLLQRASALLPDDSALNMLIGEEYFERGEFALAKRHLECAFEAEPNDEQVRLLLGLVCGDTGSAARAYDLLNLALDASGESFAARCGLGRLLGSEGKWTQALVAFKFALAAKPSAEAHYAVGCVYFQLGRDRMAARHQRKALALDAGYMASTFALAVALLRLGRLELANAALSIVAESEDPRYRRIARRILKAGAVPTNLKPFGVVDRQRRGLITSGDERLAHALRLDALGLDRMDGE